MGRAGSLFSIVRRRVTMADMNRITLASRGVSRSSDALTDRMTIGSLAAFGQPPAFRSFPLGLSPQEQRPGYETGLRQDHVGVADVDCAVVGAGRLRGSTGILRRGLAITARLAI